MPHAPSRPTRSPRRAAALMVMDLLTLAALPLAGCHRTTPWVKGTLDNFAVHRNRGFEQYRAGDYAASAESFRLAAQRSGSDVTSLYWWAVSEINQNRFNEAQFPLEQALVIAPDHPQWTPRIVDRLAEVYFQQGRYDKLHAFLTDTVDQTSRDARAFQRQAFYLLKTGDPDGALLALEKAAYFADPDDPQPYIALADFFESVNNLPAAREKLRMAYYIDPQAPDVAARLRGYGVVLGPAAGLPPTRTVSDPSTLVPQNVVLDPPPGTPAAGVEEAPADPTAAP